MSYKRHICADCGTHISPKATYCQPCARKRFPPPHHFGPAHPQWNGGRRIDVYGYVRLLVPNHPRADKNGYIKEHRYVMEQHLGRLLETHEHVHHINGDKADNRLENLRLMPEGEHHALHGWPKWKRSVEHRAKLSAAHRGQPAWNKGRAWTEDTKRKVSDSVRKLWQDPAYRQQMSESHKRRCNTPEGRAEMRRRRALRTPHG